MSFSLPLEILADITSANLVSLFLAFTCAQLESASIANNTGIASIVDIANIVNIANDANITFHGSINLNMKIHLSKR